MIKVLVEKVNVEEERKDENKDVEMLYNWKKKRKKN